MKNAFFLLNLGQYATCVSRKAPFRGGMRHSPDLRSGSGLPERVFVKGAPLAPWAAGCSVWLEHTVHEDT